MIYSVTSSTYFSTLFYTKAMILLPPTVITWPFNKLWAIVVVCKPSLQEEHQELMTFFNKKGVPGAMFHTNKNACIGDVIFRIFERKRIRVENGKGLGLGIRIIRSEEIVIHFNHNRKSECLPFLFFFYQWPQQFNFSFQRNVCLLCCS